MSKFVLTNTIFIMELEVRQKGGKEQKIRRDEGEEFCGSQKNQFD